MTDGVFDAYMGATGLPDIGDILKKFYGNSKQLF